MWRRGRHRTPVTPSLANRAPPLPVRVREHALALPPTCPPQHASAIVHFGANRARASSGNPPQARPRRAHRQHPHRREAATAGLALAQLPAPQGLAHIRTHHRPTCFCEEASTIFHVVRVVESGNDSTLKFLHCWVTVKVWSLVKDPDFSAFLFSQLRVFSYNSRFKPPNLNLELYHKTPSWLNKLKPNNLNR